MLTLLLGGQVLSHFEMFHTKDANDAYGRTFSHVTVWQGAMWPRPEF